MDRRTFLKGIAGASLTGLTALVLPSLPPGTPSRAAPALLESRALNRLLQGTGDGLVLESLDGGLTWRTVSNFGSHCSVRALLEHQGKVVAQIFVQGHGFFLSSSDARKWYTAGVIPAA